MLLNCLILFAFRVLFRYNFLPEAEYFVFSLFQQQTLPVCRDFSSGQCHREACRYAHITDSEHTISILLLLYCLGYSDPSQLLLYHSHSRQPLEFLKFFHKISLTLINFSHECLYVCKSFTDQQERFLRSYVANILENILYLQMSKHSLMFFIQNSPVFTFATPRVFLDLND